MNIDNIITLDNGNNYLLLTEYNLGKDKYFFCVKMGSKLPINEYEFIKEIKRDNKTYISVVKEKNLIDRLYDMLTKTSLNIE